MKSFYPNIFFVFILVLSGNNCRAQVPPTSASKDKVMKPATSNTDQEMLSRLNAQFILNFINQDTAAHNQIIHKDFVCIEGNGAIVDRDRYMRDWATDYSNGKFTSFSITDEVIRIFGDMALVRSKTVYTRIKGNKEVLGNSIYTDTYIKENGRWWCVQAQITPIAGY